MVKNVKMEWWTSSAGKVAVQIKYKDFPVSRPIQSAKVAANDLAGYMVQNQWSSTTCHKPRPDEGAQLDAYEIIRKHEQNTRRRLLKYFQAKGLK